MNKIFANRLIAQCETVIINVAYRVSTSPLAWKDMAEKDLAKQQEQAKTGAAVIDAATGEEVETVSLPKIQEYINDSAGLYISNMQWVSDLLNDPALPVEVVDALSSKGYKADDFHEAISALTPAAEAVRDADTSSHEAIIASCDSLAAAAQKIPSIWPE